MKYQLLSISLLLFTLLSCIEEKQEVHYSFYKAKENRKELEKVIDIYKSKKDSLKKKAAYFLIENMEDKKYYSGEEYAIFLQFIDSAWSTNISREDFKQLVQQYKDEHISLIGNPTIKYDLQTIQANNLAENIDFPFQTWEQTTWHSHFTFEDFCEYILPYRTGNEPLVEYRSNYYKHYKSILNKANNIQSIKEATAYMLNHAFPFTMELIDYPDFCPDFDPILLQKIKAGRCMDYVSHAVTVLRSVGIPAAIDFIPQWPNRAGSHSWGIVLTEDRTIIDFEGAGVKQLGNHFTISSKMAKIYRKTYAKQKNSLALISEEPIPAFFRNPYFYDVSNQYFDGIEITIEVPENTNNKFAYLAVFDNKNWYPIAWSDIQGQTAHFSHIGCDIIYLPALYTNDSIAAIGYPLKIDSLGNTTKIVPDETKNQTIKLYRKYPVLDWWNTRNQAMKGGKFQAANNADFSDAIDVYTIPEVPEMCYNTVRINSKDRYKYWRYFPISSCSSIIAELDFYDFDGNKCTGRIIGTDVEAIHIKHSKEKAFDGDPLTFFGGENDSISGYWVGMAFDKPTKIHKIRFLCRNDDNFIKEKELYELFYWKDGGWASLGQQVGGKEQFLIYENAPRNALFWLRNLTKGKEERIFTYEDEKQVWW